MDIEVLPLTPEPNPLDFVTVDQMKEHLRIKHGALDSQIRDAIRDAVTYLHGPEGRTRRTLLRTKYRLYMKALDCSFIELPFPPLVSVESIGYLDTSNVAQTVPTENYLVRTQTLFGSIELLQPYDWPVTRAQYPRAAFIDFTAGYTPTTFPDQLKRAVKFLAAHYIENTEATINEPRQMQINRKVEFALDSILDNYAVPHNYASAYGG